MARPRSDIQTRILHAARARFLAEGVDGASLRQIARAAKTSIGMVYYYFPTKDDLFLAVVEEVYALLLSDLLPALDPSLPVRERILRLYERVGRITDDERMVIRLVLREAFISSSRMDSILERFQRGHLPLMLRLLMDGVSSGEFDPSIHPVVVMLSLMALGGPAQLLRAVAGKRSPFPDIPSGKELSEQMLRILFEGVGNKSKGAT
ncbi:MAG TPA: TetR/AcrR family transcriptional regulator [Polyangiaceae bacterium]|nr:TetR/AcrR family transcriptional regulator [Polyangiaceae bacterium]